MTKDIKIQLVGNNEGYLTLAEDSDFPFTLSASDIKKPQSKKSDYSKTIKFDWNKNNADILCDIYDVDVFDGTVNQYTKQDIVIVINGTVWKDNCILRLIEVEKIQTNSQNEEKITVSGQITSGTSDIFGILKERELTDIKLTVQDIPTNASVIYNADFITASNDNDYTDGFKMLFQGSRPNNLMQEGADLKSFAPATFLWTYWNAIIKLAGFRYTFEEIGVVNSNLVSPLVDKFDFRKLLIPFADEIKSNVLSLSVDNSAKANGSGNVYSSFVDFNYLIATDNINESRFTITPTNTPAEVYDYSNRFASNTYTSAVTGILNINVKAEFDAFILNTSGNFFVSASGGDDIVFQIEYLAYVNGFLVDSTVAGNIVLLGSTALSLAPGVDKFLGTEEVELMLSVPIIPTDTVVVKSRIRATSNTPRGTNGEQYRYYYDVTNLQLTFNPSVNNSALTYGSVLDFNNFIPSKVKQSDFISDILTVFNLFAYIDEDDNNLIHFETKDKFYSKGLANPKTYNQKLVKNKPQTIKHLSEVTEKKIVLSYKKSNDELGKVYLSTYGSEYGAAIYNLSSEHGEGEKKIELKVFSPAILQGDEIMTGGYYVTKFGKGSNYLVYDNGKINKPLEVVNFYDSNNVASSQIIPAYPIASHFNSLTNPTKDLNFGLLQGMFTSRSMMVNQTANTLSFLYWMSTLNQLNSSTLMTCYLDTSDADIKDLKLWDALFIGRDYWGINAIIDFNPIKTYLTKFELFLLESESTVFNRLPIQGTNEGVISVGGTGVVGGVTVRFPEEVIGLPIGNGGTIRTPKIEIGDIVIDNGGIRVGGKDIKSLFASAFEELVLHTDTTAQVGGVLATFSGNPITVDFGDGTVQNLNSLEAVTHIYSTPFTGNVKISTLLGLGDIQNITAYNDSLYWDFDIAELTKLKNANTIVFQGTKMKLTYSTAVWNKVPEIGLVLRGYDDKLTSAEVDQILIDIDNSVGSGTGTIDLSTNENNTATSALAVSSLTTKGYTLILNP